MSGISSSKHNCKLFLNQHSSNQLRLPDLFEKDALDLLVNTLEHKRFHLCPQDDLVLLINTCGYLLIKSDMIHSFLLNLLLLKEVRTSKSGTAFLYELNRNRYLEIPVYYMQGVDHPDFYSPFGI